MRNLQLTPERLNLEYLQWTLENLGDRNKDDLRFGQYLDSKYDLKLHVSDRSTGLFYEEKADVVYDKLLIVLEVNNVQNTL
jgi:hypothetical protein